MKKYLYEIRCYDKTGGVVTDTGIPYMPRVFAEKQAKQMNKAEQRRFGKLPVKYKARKTEIPTTDGTPHGWRSWEEWYLKTFGVAY